MFVISYTPTKNLDLLDYLAYTLQASHRLLGELLVAGTRHLAPEEKPPLVELMQDPLRLAYVAPLAWSVRTSFDASCDLILS